MSYVRLVVLILFFPFFPSDPDYVETVCSILWYKVFALGNKYVLPEQPLVATFPLSNSNCTNYNIRFQVFG